MKYLPVLLIALLTACGGSEKPAEPAAASVAASAPVSASTAQAEQTFTPVPDIKPVWQIMDIAGQPQAAVEKILGQPQGACENNKYGKSCEYQTPPAEWSITYINGRADWILLRDPRIDNALTSPVWLGLPYETPTTAAPALLEWSNYPGLLDYAAHVSMDNKALEYIYIKVRTP